MRTLVIAIALMSCVVAGFAQAQVVNDNDRPSQSMTLPVYFDTTRGHALSASEQYFLSTVPETDGLRSAVREMLVTDVVHVPTSGVYRAGDSVRYWSMYQAVTSPHKVTVPTVAGPQGPRGEQGPEGPQGPPGPPAPCQSPCPTVNNYYNFGGGPSWIPACQLGGQYGPLVNGTALASVTLQQPSRISITSIGYGGAGGSSNVVNNNSNSNANTNVNGNTINLGSGSATGTNTGTSTSGARSISGGGHR